MLSNPYLNINFPIWLNFEDYDEKELLNLAVHLLNEKGFNLDNEAHYLLDKLIVELYSHKDLTLKNGLLIESLVDSVIRNQSIRICNDNIIQKEISVINSKDISMCKNDFFNKNFLK